MTRRSVKTRVAAAITLLAFAATGCGLAPSAANVANGKSGEPEAGGPRQKAVGLVSTPAPTPADVAGGLDGFYQQRLSWKDCLSGGLQCAKLRVPIDYRRPAGKTIELALMRFPAKEPDKRLGSLVINPGGPGGSGVQYASNAPVIFGAPVKARYDIVGFDPRGVAGSAPVDCLSDADMDTFLAADGSPDTAQEKRDLAKLSEEFGRGCAQRTGELLGHVSTDNVARDLDVLRGALGDQQLNYAGASYGTYLGAIYAELFPKRVGRFVLDAGLDPALSSKEIGLGQAKGFELAVDSFLDDCVERDDCPLGDNRTEAYATLDGLLDEVDRRPLQGDGKREVTQALAMSGIVTAMYSDLLWGKLRLALTQALNGDGRQLLELADTYADRAPDGHYRTNSGEAILAVNCLDRPDIRSVAEAEAELPEYEAASPLFGAFILWGSLPCAKWPVEPIGKPRKIEAKGAQPILVVGTTRDPATPYEWSQRLAGNLESGVLLTKDGDGHTAYGMGLTPCIDSKVDAFLAEGRMPADGTRCQAR